MTAIYILCAIISFICWLMVIIKLFKKEGVGLGILGILCAIYAYIWGWMKSTEQGLKGVMIAWTVAFIGMMATGGMAAKSMMDSPEMQKMMRDAEARGSQQAAPEPAPVTAPAPQ